MVSQKGQICVIPHFKKLQTYCFDSSLEKEPLVANFIENTRCTKMIVPSLCGYCGGAVGSIISVFTQLHRLGSGLDFETLLESM